MVVNQTENNTLLKRFSFFFLLVFLVILSFYASTNWTGWQGNIYLHSITEIVATMLALTVGILALLRYFGNKGNIFLTLGFGFFGTALLDGYHAVVTSAFFSSNFVINLDSLIPWSWTASRIYLSVVMLMSYIAVRRELKEGKEKGAGNPLVVFIVMASFVVLSIVLLSFFSLPITYFPDLFFGRSEEFISAVLFFIAMIGYLSLGEWRTNRLHFWVLMSLVVNFVNQLLFMPLSHSLFDVMFALSHVLKILSYIFVSIGMFISIYELFKVVEKKNC